MFMPIIAISLAIFGWFLAIVLTLCGWRLITRLTKRREAYDLCSSVQSLLEQLDADGRHAWEGQSDTLDEYTERKLLSKIAAVEQRLGLIRKHYYPADPSGITDEQLLYLRQLLTADSRLISPKEPRTVAIHGLITDMVGSLLEENYAYINESPWRPTQMCPVNRPLPPICWLLLCAGLGLLWVAVYYLYVLAVIGPGFFAAPLRAIEWLPMAMIGVITPVLWSLFRPWRLAPVMRRGILIGYIAAMPVAFSLALGFRMLASPVVWVPGIGVVLLIGMALGYAVARLLYNSRP